MPAVVTALPTVWRGVKFRSRQEARWAIFLDQMGIRWSYEPEGYALPSGFYLPDFLLPDLSWWLEIKPDNPSKDVIKASDAITSELAEATNMRVAIAWGYPDPSRIEDSGPAGDGPGLYSGHEYANGSMTVVGPEMWDNFHAFTICPRCDKLDIVFEGRAARICPKHVPASAHPDKNNNAADPRLIRAYEAGWAKRFGRQ